MVDFLMVMNSTFLSTPIYRPISNNHHGRFFESDRRFSQLQDNLPYDVQLQFHLYYHAYTHKQ